MNLKDILYLINQFTGEDNIPNQYFIIKAYLKRIFQKINLKIDRFSYPK
jgi:hypothetical protein